MAKSEKRHVVPRLLFNRLSKGFKPRLFYKNILHLAVMVRCTEYMCLRRSAIGLRIKEHPRFFPNIVDLDLYLNKKTTGTKTTLSPVEAPVLNEPLTILLYNCVQVVYLEDPELQKSSVCQTPPTSLLAPEHTATYRPFFPPTAHSIFFLFDC